MSKMGSQASTFGNGIAEIRKMIESKLNPPESDRKIAEEKDSSEATNCKIFLGYTSNMASCGVRETIKFLCKHKMVDVIVKGVILFSVFLSWRMRRRYNESYFIYLETLIRIE